MAISRQIQRHLEGADFDSLEADWLSRLSDDPTDLDYAVGVARALAGRQEDERARFLLELWDEELVARDLWQTRLALLRRAGLLLREVEELHREIERTLHALFPGHTRLTPLAELVGLHRAVEDVDKLWTKADRLLAILPFDAGTVVAIPARGVGRVVDVNVELQSLKVELTDGASLMVGFRAAGKTLSPLASEHVLRQKLENADELRRLATEAPVELLRRVLTSYDRSLAAAEIRDAVAGIVPQEAWSTWWNGVRRHPQLLHHAEGRSTYSWAQSTADAQEALWTSFESAAPRQRIDLLRRHAERSPALAARMAQALAAQAAQHAGREPAVALEIALALRRLGTATEGDAPDAEHLLAELAEPLATLQQVSDRALREEAYRLLPQARPDWPELVDTLMRREEDPRAVATLGELLAAQEPKLLDRVIDQVLSQPRKAPAAFLWLLEQAREREDLRRRSPLRLLKQFLQALEWDEFKTSRVALVAELESGRVAARLLASLDADQAAQAVAALKRAPIEEYLRTPLITALQLRFPELAGKRESPLYALPASIAVKREELRQLRENEIPSNRHAIQEAREMGDLRENFEYKAARQRHEYLMARLAELENELDRARPIDLAAVDADQVRIGCRVALAGDGGTSRTYTILGPWESDPERDVLSHESNLAESLLGRRPGDTVELPDGVFRIEHVSRIPNAG